MTKITIRPSEEEYNLLVEYCKKKKRTQNDVIREFIRSLGGK